MTYKQMESIMSAKIDLTGMKFSRLTVLKQSPRKDSRPVWECKCECGSKVLVSTSALRTGNTKSCGCARIIANKNRCIDLTGKTFGKWMVVCRAENIGRRTFWLCECECGGKRPVQADSLSGGISTNCGCERNKKTISRNTTHGMYGRPERNVWQQMIGRCTNKNDESYKNYGGRGIKVCDKWRNDFLAFLKDMGPRPFDGAQIDRFPNNNGNYEPGNCRWTTRKNNLRNTRKNRFLEFDGKRLTVAEWSEVTGISQSAIYSRLDKMGWSIEKSLSTPVKKTLKIYK